MSKYGENTVRFIDRIIVEGVASTVFDYYPVSDLEQIEDEEIRDLALKVAAAQDAYDRLNRIAIMVEDGEDPHYPYEDYHG